MKKILFSFIFLGFYMLFIPNENITKAQQIPVLELFHGAECPHCHKELKWLPTLQKMYPNLQIKKYEVWHVPKNRVLMKKRLDEIGKESKAVPTNIIGDEVVVGFNPEGILALMKKNYGDPVAGIVSEAAASGNSKIESDNSKTLWLVIGGVLIAISGGLFVFGKRK